MRTFWSYFFILITFVLICSCANRGRPSGGPEDETPPVIIKTSPENFSINFTDDEIKIQFDEYIKINNLQKNLIISPPMDPEPIITPLGSASKSITIKITDTLLANTTYSFNFGESIEDNNEGNPYPYYKYVFSTGDYIDSLKIGGVISDALERTPEEFVSVMLYEVDSSYTDSVIYQKKPKYVATTKDSTSIFELANLKEGKYLMVALKDESGNYIYEPKTDKIGFVKEFVEIPGDSIFDIELFKEELDFKPLRGSLISGQKIAFGYEGNPEHMKMDLINAPSAHEKRVTSVVNKDSLFYWYKPNIEQDSLLFRVTSKEVIDTVNVRMRNLPKDTLVIKSLQSNTLLFTEDFTIEGTIPFTKLDRSKISLINTDSIDVDYTTALDSLKNQYKFIFEKEENTSYHFTLLPEAIEDFFGNVNDTLKYSLRTREYSDYGNFRLQLVNAKFPLIVQLIDNRGEVYKEQYVTENKPVDFFNLQSGVYFLRVIFDENRNGKYDPGNFLLRRQSERVSYAEQPVEVRSSYDLIETFTLQD